MRKLVLLIPTVAALFAVIACGGDNEKASSSQSAPPSPMPAAPQVLELRSIDQGSGFAYEPATLSAKTGEVTVKFVNNTIRQHDFTVRNKSGQGDLFKSGEFDPGTSGEVKFALTEAGQYEFLCTHTGHADRGLRGTLTVVASLGAAQ